MHSPYGLYALFQIEAPTLNLDREVSEEGRDDLLHDAYRWPV